MYHPLRLLEKESNCSAACLFRVNPSNKDVISREDWVPNVGTSKVMHISCSLFSEMDYKTSRLDSSRDHDVA